VHGRGLKLEFGVKGGPRAAEAWVRTIQLSLLAYQHQAKRKFLKTSTPRASPCVCACVRALLTCLRHAILTHSDEAFGKERTCARSSALRLAQRRAGLQLGAAARRSVFAVGIRRPRLPLRPLFLPRLSLGTTNRFPVPFLQLMYSIYHLSLCEVCPRFLCRPTSCPDSRLRSWSRCAMMHRHMPHHPGSSPLSSDVNGANITSGVWEGKRFC
jgi:hypothetical protein